MQKGPLILLGALVFLALIGYGRGRSTPTADPEVVAQAVEATLTAMAPQEAATRSPAEPAPAPSPTTRSSLALPPIRQLQPAAENVTVKGDPNAPVTIIEYSDFK